MLTPQKITEDDPLPEARETLPVIPKERYDLRILTSLRRILRSVEIYSRKLASEHGVTVPQLLCMLKLDELGSLTLKELADEVYLTSSTLVGVVDRLERSALVQRERSVMDRRKVRILLTDRGRDILESSPSPLQDCLASSIEGLPELERATIALSLEKIITLMEHHPEIESEAAPPILDTELS